MSGAADAPPAPRPWSAEADRLLVAVLLDFRQIPDQQFRRRLVALVGRSAEAAGIESDVVENGQPRAHLWNLVDAVAARADPWARWKPSRRPCAPWPRTTGRCPGWS
ncbi:hypothetical protein ABTX81_13940 [Kitasatospora sp. NPDC097605]|uniref:hypothetical protein n=1 Tax=Kitasatospora sp. NPDC097605 TaxID=3157226 RepID=UPI003320F14C